jgi:hypothetical protein
MRKAAIAAIISVPALMGNQGGCGTDPPVTKIVVQGDTFCKLTTDPQTKQFELTWDVHDTPPTITGIERMAAKYDRVCRGKKKLAEIK